MDYADITILVVDDSSTMRFFTKNAVRDLGVKNIVEAACGERAVEILEKRKIDLVIADWNMPGMDGLTLLRWVRSNDETRNLPFLMLTSEVRRESILEAVREKVSEYMIKPFAPATLNEKIRRILG
jgi:two-component system chemotaxis response regulator CheY